MGRFKIDNKGCSNKITIKQHILPRKSIERFTDTSNQVYVLRKDRECFPANPGNEIFCCHGGKQRAWSQTTENGYFKENVEDRFQNLAQKIINDHQKTDMIFNQEKKELINAFTALW